MTETPTDARLSRISTNWNLLSDAHHGQGDAVSRAQAALMGRYCGAVYRYLLAAVRDPDVAADLAQEFALRFLRGDFRRADPKKGRFRDYVKRALYHLIVDHRRRLAMQPGPLPPYDDAPTVVEEPGAAGDEEFVRHWRGELLDHAWKALEALEESTGQLSYTVLRWRIDHQDAPAAQLAEELTARLGRPFTEAGVRKALSRARKRFADLLREEVARSLETNDAERMQEELSDLELLPYVQAG